MIGNFRQIEDLYRFICSLPKLDSDFCIAFVYNSAEKIRDTIHAAECIFPEERRMIVNSFRQIADYVYPFDGEGAFADAILELKHKHKYVLVYSMAQNINGIGRRCMVPLLCDYYDLINIGAGFMECVYGGSKYLMYKITKNLPDIRFPKTYYVLSPDDLDHILNQPLPGSWLLKPNDESASIGMEVFSPGEYTKETLHKKLKTYQKNYPIFCVQEYIEGAEIAVPLLWYRNQYYCPGISEVVFHTDHHFLDYDTICLGNCSYQEYFSPLSDGIIESSIQVASALGFRAISRIDYRIKDGIGYIEDIGPNPTISEKNGANELFRLHLQAPGSCVYQLMLYSALEQHGLFKPPFNYAPENR